MRRPLLLVAGVAFAGLALLFAVLAFTTSIETVAQARLSVLFGLGACFALLGSFACFSKA